MTKVSVPDASRPRCLAIAEWVEAHVSPLVRKYETADQPVWCEGDGWAILWSYPGGPIEVHFEDESNATLFLLRWA